MKLPYFTELNSSLHILVNHHHHYHHHHDHHLHHLMNLSRIIAIRLPVYPSTVGFMTGSPWYLAQGINLRSLSAYIFLTE
jgi:hypothetical protein